jgi:1-deoxy-D-xylulose-5-phosphate reductoisomerase
MTGNRSVLVLGSTGSIGTQALELIARHPERFTVAGLAAGGGDVALLAEQARAHHVPRWPSPPRTRPTRLRDLLPGVEVLAGPTRPPSSPPPRRRHGAQRHHRRGRPRPTPGRARRRGHARARQQGVLVAGGALVTAAAAPGQIVPVDSEHSAPGPVPARRPAEEVDRLGAHRLGRPVPRRPRADLADVTVAAALAHPTWDMGPMVTLNSATLINKGLELIEAHLLFGIPYDRIDVVVHPQSIVHSMVTFVDGATIAQASPPDMRLPIGLALAWPQRLPGAAPSCRWDTAQSWTFEPLDDDALPGVRLARAAGALGGCVPAVLNAANEEAVGAFLAGACTFTGITDTLARVLEAADAWTADPATVADVLAAQDWARARAREIARENAQGVAR